MKDKIKKDRPTFVGLRPQYFKHKDDVKERRKRDKQVIRDYYRKGE